MDSISQVMKVLPNMIEHEVPGIGDDASPLSQATVKVLTDRDKLRTATPSDIFAWNKYCSRQSEGGLTDCFSKSIVDGLWSMVEPSCQVGLDTGWQWLFSNWILCIVEPAEAPSKNPGLPSNPCVAE